MTVVVAGGTGFIGKALVAALAREGYDVAVISRREGAGTYTWDDIESQGLTECEAVINLAGRPTAEGRWNTETKKEILESRVESTETLVRAIAKNPPKVFINASAVGYYPALIDEVWTEERGVTADESFLSRVSHEWETAARLPLNCPTRAVVVRIGLALGRGGGALKAILPPFKKGLGGRFGSGYQPMPWIHIDDLVALFIFLLRNEGATGPYNAVAPGVVTNREFTQTLAKTLRRPAILAVPAWVLRLALGEKADLLLQGQNVVPKRAVELGFHFAYETLESALSDLVGKS